MGQSLDQQAEELSSKLNELYSAQIKVLTKSKQVAEKASLISKRILPAFSFILMKVDSVSRVVDGLLEEIIKGRLLNKLLTLTALEVEASYDKAKAKGFCHFIRYLTAPLFDESQLPSPFRLKDDRLEAFLSKVNFLTLGIDNEYLRNYFALMLF